MLQSATSTRIIRDRLIAVIRLNDAAPIPRVVEELGAGGISIIEITLTTPGALKVMAEVAVTFGDDILLGAGSVFTAAEAGAAADAGAEFLVSPVHSQGMLDVASERGLVGIPGAYTPTEMYRATQAGADFVKVFPSDSLGPGFIKAVLAPMPGLKLIPTGGVTLENARQWIDAGCAALGLGTALVAPRLIEAGDYAELRSRASRLRDAIV